MNSSKPTAPSPPSRLQSPLLLPHRGHGLAARDGRERGVVALDPAARGRGARCVRIRRRRGSEQRPAAEARARMRPRRRGGGGGGDGSGEPRRADDAGDARGVLHRGHRESRGVERVNALAADPLVALPLETLVLGAQSGLGEVRHALRGEHRGVDAVLEAGADGARGGERGRGRVARVAVRDVVDGNSAEVELADGGANPRLRGARGRRGGGEARESGRGAIEIERERRGEHHNPSEDARGVPNARAHQGALVAGDAHGVIPGRSKRAARGGGHLVNRHDAGEKRRERMAERDKLASNWLRPVPSLLRFPLNVPSSGARRRLGIANRDRQSRNIDPPAALTEEIRRDATSEKLVSRRRSSRSAPPRTALRRDREGRAGGDGSPGEAMAEVEAASG